MKLIFQIGYPWDNGKAFSDSDVEKGLEELVSEKAPSVSLTLEGVIHVELKHTMTVQFVSPEATKQAQAITGWEYWDKEDNILYRDPDPSAGYDFGGFIVDRPYLIELAGEPRTWPQTEFCGFIVAAD